jgi:hypothetical protein
MHSAVWKIISGFRRDAAEARRLAASISDFRSIRDLTAFAESLEADRRCLMRNAGTLLARPG